MRKSTFTAVNAKEPLMSDEVSGKVGQSESGRGERRQGGDEATVDWKEA